MAEASTSGLHVSRPITNSSSVPGAPLRKRTHISAGAHTAYSGGGGLSLTTAGGVLTGGLYRSLNFNKSVVLQMQTHTELAGVFIINNAISLRNKSLRHASLSLRNATNKT